MSIAKKVQKIPIRYIQNKQRSHKVLDQLLAEPVKRRVFPRADRARRVVLDAVFIMTF